MMLILDAQAALRVLLPMGGMDNKSPFRDVSIKVTDRSDQPFEGFLRAQFKNKPGESKIIDGKFHIIDLQHRRSIVKKEDWNRFISRGAVLTMSMVMSHLRRKPGQCPRPDCTGVGIVKCCDSDQLTW